MQNPSDLTTLATRKTTRSGVRDAKYNAAGAMHRVAWALQNSKAIGQKCEKPCENQGFAAERTGTELLDFFDASIPQEEKVPNNDPDTPALQSAALDRSRDRR